MQMQVRRHPRAFGVAALNRAGAGDSLAAVVAAYAAVAEAARALPDALEAAGD
jgi:hypothetical protein